MIGLHELPLADAPLTGAEVLPLDDGARTALTTVAELRRGLASEATVARVEAALTSTTERAGLYRDAVDGAYAVLDAEGRAGLLLDDVGRLLLAGLHLRGEAPPSRDVTPYDFAFTDLLNRVILGFAQSGYVDIALGDVLKSVASSAPRDTGRDALAITDMAGQLLIAVTQVGEIRLRLSDESLREHMERAYLAPSVMRGLPHAANVRRTASLLIGTVQEGPAGSTMVRDVVQRRNGWSTTAVVQDSRPLELVLFQGQSNAGNGNPGISVPTLYPHHMLQLGASPQTYGDTATDFGVVGDVAPYANPGGVGPYVASMAGVALEAWDREAGRASPGRLLHSCWYGSQPLSSFQSGTNSWANLMAAAAKATSLAATYGRAAECKAHILVQGENDDGNASYAGDLITYVNTVRPALRAQTGQAALPKIIIAQTNSGSFSYSAKEQYRVALAQVANGVYLAGPMYQCPLYDAIHPNDLGRALHGEQLALVYEAVVTNEQVWNPLWPTAVTRTNNVIDVTFALPPGGGALAWDTSWVPATTNYGFSYTDSNSGFGSIASVAITGANTVRITLVATPTGANKKLHYAMTAGTTAPGWIAARGQLISPTTRQSVWARRGLAVPATVNHYAVRFEVPVP